MTNPELTQALIDAATAETARLERDLDITNADHIALWLEANLDDDTPLGWLACRIVEAHERATLTKEAPADPAGEVGTLIDQLRDPNVVHVNILRGSIAKPSVAQIVHIYGEDVLRAALPKPAQDVGVLVERLERLRNRLVTSTGAQISRTGAKREIDAIIAYINQEAPHA